MICLKLCHYEVVAQRFSGYPAGTSGKEPACQCRRHKTRWLQSLGQEDSLEEGMATYSSISCLENPMDRGAWRAVVHMVAKSQTQLKRLSTPILRFSPQNLCSVLSTHSSLAAWSILIPMAFLKTGSEFHRHPATPSSAPLPSFLAASHWWQRVFMGAPAREIW